MNKNKRATVELPLDEAIDVLKNTPGVELRPITEADKKRVGEVFKSLGVTPAEDDDPEVGKD